MVYFDRTNCILSYALKVIKCKKLLSLENRESYIPEFGPAPRESPYKR
jgi:hypothetical protein